MEIRVSSLSHFIFNKDGKFKLKVRQLKIEIWRNFMSNYNIIFDKVNLMLKAAAQPWAQRLYYDRGWGASLAFAA